MILHQKTVLFQYIIVTMLWSVTFAEMPLGKPPPEITLSGECGGRVDKGPWSSNELKGKVVAIYYVSPDKSDINTDYYEAVKKEHFPPDQTGSFAIINMKSTWLPAIVITTVLKQKQQHYKRTVYVQDYCKLLVDKWHLTDHSSDNLIFDRKGNVIFSKDGKMTTKDIRTAIERIWGALNN